MMPQQPTRGTMRWDRTTQRVLLTMCHQDIADRNRSIVLHSTLEASLTEAAEAQILQHLPLLKFVWMLVQRENQR